MQTQTGICIIPIPASWITCIYSSCLMLEAERACLRKCMFPKWHPIPYVVHYIRQRALSKVVHYIGQGYSTLTLRGPEPAGFSVLPDNELHPPGVPGLNQSLCFPRLGGSAEGRRWLRGRDVGIQYFREVGVVMSTAVRRLFTQNPKCVYRPYHCICVSAVDCF